MASRTPEDARALLTITTTKSMSSGAPPSSYLASIGFSGRGALPRHQERTGIVWGRDVVVADTEHLEGPESSQPEPLDDTLHVCLRVALKVERLSGDGS